MTAARGSRWEFPFACLCALGALLGAYSNSFRNSFHFDDSHVVEDNVYIRSLANVPRFFTDAATSSSYPTNAVYRPLMTTTLAVDYWLGGGLEVSQFHLTQLTLLVILGILLFLFYRRLMSLVREDWWISYAALFAAALFCLHATNTETMNIIAVRAELLSAIGLVGSFLVYLHLPRSRPAHLYLLPMIAGAFAKSPAVIFAPLFFVYLLLFEERLTGPDLFHAQGWRSVGRALRRSLPALLSGLAVFLFIESMNNPAASHGGGDRLDYLQTQAFVWLHYGRLFFLPVGLTADTDWGLIPHWYDTRVLAGLLFVALLLCLVWSASKVAALRPVAFGVAWFMLALMPASSVFPLAEVTNEHRVFLPYIGLALAVTWGSAAAIEGWWKRMPRARPWLTAAASVLGFALLAGNAVGTYQRNQVWRSGETLWRDVTEKSPGNGRGWMNYGLSQMAQGRYEEAKRLFERAQTLIPNYAALETNLGIVIDRLGQPEEAEGHFKRAMELRPDDASPKVFYARWLVERGRPVEAIPHLEAALQLSSANVAARHQLLDAYAMTARRTELEALAKQTLALVPDDAKARQYLSDSGTVVLPTLRPSTPRVETAAALLDASLRLYQAKDYHGSLAAAKRALELEPDYAEAYNNVAASLASLGQWEEAIVAAREALRLKPDFQLARNNLAWAESQSQRSAGSGSGQ